MKPCRRISWTASLLVGALVLTPPMPAQDAEESISQEPFGQPSSWAQPDPQAWRGKRERWQETVPEPATSPALPGSGHEVPPSPQGAYQIPLPPGAQPIQAIPPPGPQPIELASLPPTIHHDVSRMVTKIQGELGQIRLGLTRLQAAPLLAELDVVVAQTEKLASLAAQRTEVPTVRAHFDLYELNWLHLATRLRAMPGANPWMIGHVDAVEHLNDLLEELLLAGPHCVYNHGKVAALTAELADATSLLLRVVKVHAARVPGQQELVFSAQRVHGAADQLALAVRQSGAFTVILEQFEQFLQAWKGLAGQLVAPSPLEPQVQPLVEKIAQIQTVLVQQLLVEPPICAIHSRRVALAASIAQLGDALVAALVKELLATAGPVRAAEEFTEAAQSLYLWLKAHPMPKIDITRPEVVALMDAWTRLRNQLNRLERANFPLAFKIAEQIVGELETLNAVLKE